MSVDMPRCLPTAAILFCLGTPRTAEVSLQPATAFDRMLLLRVSKVRRALSNASERDYEGDRELQSCCGPLVEKIVN